MADQITATDKVYLHKTAAWHGKGDIFAEPLSGEFTRRHVCDWEPRTRFLWIKPSPDAAATIKVADKKAIVRSDDGQYLGTVGNGYGLIGNKEMFDLIETALPGVKYETAGTLFGGKRVWALAPIGGFTLKGGDETRNYLMAANGFDGSFRLFFGRTDVRIVCNNTLTAAISGGEVAAYRHTSGVKARATDAAKAIRKAKEGAEQYAEQAKKLSAVRISGKQVRAYFEDVFPAPKGKKETSPIELATSGILDEILNQHNDRAEVGRELLANHKEATARQQAAHTRLLDTLLEIYGSDKNAGGHGESLWTAFNSCTEYVDHHRSTRGTDDADRSDNRMASVVWGSGNQIKQLALTTAVGLLPA